MPTFQILEGHWMEKARELPDRSVHVCVTSPPYWGLRNYKTEPQVWGGDPTCEHEWRDAAWYRNGGGRTKTGDTFMEAGEANAANIKESRWVDAATCATCGAWRGELGQEPTPRLYIQHIVEVFREVRRVLRDDGTLWINIGDSYNGYYGNTGVGQGFAKQRQERGSAPYPAPPTGSGLRTPNLKATDLVGIPWMLAFALRDDGWYLRRDNIWAKVNCMPESVYGTRWEKHRIKVGTQKGAGKQPTNQVSLTLQTGGTDLPEWKDCQGCPKCEKNDGLILRRGSGRPTTSHEYIFMLAKTDDYFFDSDAIAEPTDAIAEYNSGNGNQDLHRMSADETPRSLFAVEERSNGTRGEVQGVPQLRDGEMEPNGSRTSIALSSGTALQHERERQGAPPPVESVRRKAESESEVGAGTQNRARSLSAATSENRTTPSDPEALLRERKRESRDKTLSADPERQGEPVPKQPQAARTPERAGMFADGGRMAGDSGEATTSLRDLPRAAEANQGSHPTNKQGRRARKRQHSGTMPELQRKEGQSRKCDGNDRLISQHGTNARLGRCQPSEVSKPTRNKRSVWTITSQPYTEDHFAAFPEELPETCIKAGTSERGVCAECGAPWARVVKRAEAPHDGKTESGYESGSTAKRLALLRQAARERGEEYAQSTQTLGWRATCDCNAGEPVPATVLDPFLGRGTTGTVAVRLARNFIGCDLQPKYVTMARKNIKNEAPLFVTETKGRESHHANKMATSNREPAASPTSPEPNSAPDR